MLAEDQCFRLFQLLEYVHEVIFYKPYGSFEQTSHRPIRKFGRDAVMGYLVEEMHHYVS